MNIKIESTHKVSEIQHVGFEEDKLIFFLLDFFYIIFNDSKEKRNFFLKFLDLTRSNFSEGKSYVELGSEALMNQSNFNDGILQQDTTNLDVLSYDFTITKDYLAITFHSDKDSLKMVLYKKLINELRMNEEYILRK